MWSYYYGYTIKALESENLPKRNNIEHSETKTKTKSIPEPKNS